MGDYNKVVMTLPWYLERVDMDTDIHVIPVYRDEPEHEESVTCWCEPVLDFENGDTSTRLWNHRRIN